MEEDFRLQTSKSPTTITFSGYKKPTDRLTLMVVLSLQVAFTSKETYIETRKHCWMEDWNLWFKLLVTNVMTDKSVYRFAQKWN